VQTNIKQYLLTFITIQVVSSGYME